LSRCNPGLPPYIIRREITRSSNNTNAWFINRQPRSQKNVSLSIIEIPGRTALNCFYTCHWFCTLCSWLCTLWVFVINI